MLLESQCSKRRCKWYRSIKQDNEDESTERVICKAFPDGIPDFIAFGTNLHLKKVKGDHGIQYEKFEE